MHIEKKMSEIRNGEPVKIISNFFATQQYKLY